MDERKLEQLFSGRTVVLQSQLRQEEAEALQARMADLGALMRIKDATPVEKSSPFFDSAKNSDKTRGDGEDYTLQDLTAAHITCPRCGHMQLDAEFCTRCGIDIRATLKQQRKEDLIIEKKIRELRAKKAPQRKAARTATDIASPTPEEALRTEDRSGANPFSGARGLKRLFKKKTD